MLLQALGLCHRWVHMESLPDVGGVQGITAAHGADDNPASAAVPEYRGGVPLTAAALVRAVNITIGTTGAPARQRAPLTT